MSLDSCLKTMAARQTEEGSFLSREGGYPRPDATAWGILGLKTAGGFEENILKARQSLGAVQLESGAVPVDREHPQSAWPTPLALLAWHGWKDGAKQVENALGFLTTPPVRPAKNTSVDIGMNTQLVGYSWIDGTSSWVEPTSMAIFALERFGKKNDRVDEGIRLLLDRQLPRGGWNYGNTVVYNMELYPSEEYIGIALTALAGHCQPTDIEKSITMLESRM